MFHTAILSLLYSNSCTVTKSKNFTFHCPFICQSIQDTEPFPFLFFPPHQHNNSQDTTLIDSARQQHHCLFIANKGHLLSKMSDYSCPTTFPTSFSCSICCAFLFLCLQFRNFYLGSLFSCFQVEFDAHCAGFLFCQREVLNFTNCQPFDQVVNLPLLVA